MVLTYRRGSVVETGKTPITDDLSKRLKERADFMKQDRGSMTSLNTDDLGNAVAQARFAAAAQSELVRAFARLEVLVRTGHEPDDGFMDELFTQS
jgi:hypothetical protein